MAARTLPSTTVSRLDRWAVHFHWPEVEAAFQLKKNHPRQGVALANLRCALLAGTKDVWVSPDPLFPSRLSSVIVTTIVATPTGKLLKVDLLVGRHVETWAESAAHNLGQFAQASGCTRMNVTGRMGWLRTYRRHHYGLPVTWANEETGSADHHHYQQQ
jgi:hypothetical protein